MRAFKFLKRAALFVSMMALALLGSKAVEQDSNAEGELVLLPFVVDQVRSLVRVDSQLLICNATQDRELQIDALQVFVDGVPVLNRELNAQLPPGPDYLEANRGIELLPREITELHRQRYFAGVQEPEYVGAEIGVQMRKVEEQVAKLREKYAADPASQPFAQPNFELPLDLVFSENQVPGTTANLSFEVSYRLDGVVRTQTANRSIVWQGPRLTLPAQLLGTGMSVHAGDLHVHSCHGEATGACAPSGNCAAESFQTSGSFSYAQLKSQFQALGMNWMSATDHSYCINDDAEYSAISAEIAAINDANFIAYPDIEVSSEEVGSQTGSDLGNTLCLFGQNQNHMGAHGISTRIAGGNAGFLGFCGSLDPFTQTVADVRSQGGFPIAHHPTAGSFAWNSFAATAGIEANALHGVEIWNGAQVSGQGGDVGQWVDWLLGGRILYAYSGSDTHDEAFGFGTNQVVLFAGEDFNPDNIKTALMQGRVSISNGPALMIEVDQGGQSLFMGTRQSVPIQSLPLPVVVRAHYDFGVQTGTVSVYSGSVGDGSEVLLGQVGGLSGSGSVEFPTSLSGLQRSWFRAYAENGAGDQTAYTNPVFFERANALTVEGSSISLSAGGSQQLNLLAGLERATDFYWIFGSATGTSPGIDFGSVNLPLNFDAYFNLTLQKPFLGIFGSFVGFLGADGTGQASLDLPSGVDPSLVGLELRHAFTTAAVIGTVDFASNAESVLLVP